MRKYVLVLIMLALPLAFTACSDDPTEDIIPQVEVPEVSITDDEEAEENIRS
ncbi:MAG: hypothetical protein MI921_16815 [Cytophagales bacterium]|nr:hypothetical protein [Cytophagales bacterium]